MTTATIVVVAKAKTIALNPMSLVVTKVVYKNYYRSKVRKGLKNK